MRRLVSLFLGALCLGLVFVCVVTKDGYDNVSGLWQSAAFNVAGRVHDYLSDVVENETSNTEDSNNNSGLRRSVYRVANNKNGVATKKEKTEVRLLGGSEPQDGTENAEQADLSEEDVQMWMRELHYYKKQKSYSKKPHGPGVSYYKWYWGNRFSRYGSNWNTSTRYSTNRYSTSKYSRPSSWSSRYSGGTRTYNGGRSYGSSWGRRWGSRNLEEGNEDLEFDPEMPPEEVDLLDDSETGLVRKRNAQANLVPQPSIGRALNLFVAGFPKCGTTTLLYALKSHPETAIGEREECDITNPNYSDGNAFSRLNNALGQLEVSDPSIKTAVKCPSGIKNFHGIERLQHHSPDARFVIGVRHPVKFFQSFYNYRITEMYNKGDVESDAIPSAQELVGSDDWKGVSTESARFELFLMQLGKTDVSVSDMAALSKKPNMAVTPSTFKVFLYSLEQLEDEDEDRAQLFRNDMQGFLQLQEPLDPFERKNKNHNVGEHAFAETIDICDNKYEDIRSLLVSHATETQEWIRTRFLSSADVFVGNRDHFEELLESWKSDPCQSKEEPVAALSSTA